MIRLLGCGSRSWADRVRVKAELVTLAPFVLIHGDCGKDDVAGNVICGADRIMGDVYFHELSGSVVAYPVDHALDGPWPSAGPRRNARMLRDGKPDRGLAFGALWRPRPMRCCAKCDAVNGYECHRSPHHTHPCGCECHEPAALKLSAWRHTGTGGMCAIMLAAGLPVRWIAAPGAAAVDLVTMPTPGEGVA